MAAPQSLNPAILRSTNETKKKTSFSPRANKISYFSSFLLEYANLVLPKLIRLNKTCLQVFSDCHISCLLFLRFRMLCFLERAFTLEQGLEPAPVLSQEISAHRTCICPWRSSFSGFIHENIQNTSVISLRIKTKSKNYK